MNSFEHPTSNKEFPISICLCVHADRTKLIPNAFSLYFIIGHSVFDIGYSSLKLITMRQRPRSRATPKQRPEKAELQRKSKMCSPYRAESFHTFTHGAAMGCRVSAPLGLNAEFNTKVSTTIEACLKFELKFKFISRYLDGTE